jgi:hypothetical protein
VYIDFGANVSRHQVGEHATHPIAHPPSCLALLLLVAGVGPAASSRLASQLGRCTLGRVQLPDLG